MQPGEAARAYVEKRGWPVFPKRGRVPFTKRGHKDATTDLAQIAEWWRQWPRALISTPTGQPSGLIVLDVDVKGGVNGFETLESLGKNWLPVTPTAHTPSGGCHLYFSVNKSFAIYCSVGKYGLGPGLDVKGEGGSITLPTPGYEYRWDPINNLKTVPLMVAPSWLGHKAPKSRGRDRDDEFQLSANEVLSRACRLIRDAPMGARHDVLNRQAFLVATLVSRGALDEQLARHELDAAATAMVHASAGSPRKTASDLMSAFRDGLMRGRP